MKNLSPRQEEEMFLDIWYEMSPETYESLWFRGIKGDLLISDMVEVYHELYKKVLDVHIRQLKE